MTTKGRFALVLLASALGCADKAPPARFPDPPPPELAKPLPPAEPANSAAPAETPDTPPVPGASEAEQAGGDQESRPNMR